MVLIGLDTVGVGDRTARARHDGRAVSYTRPVTSIVSLARDLGLPACAEALARDRLSRFPQRRRSSDAASARGLLGELCRFGPSPERAQDLLERLAPEARGHAAADVADRLLVTSSDRALLSTLTRHLDAAREATLASDALASIDRSTGEALARAIADAHLPRLACAVLAPDALADASEILLDAELFDALPDAATLAGEGTTADLELAGYVAARAELPGDADAVAARLDAAADFDYSRTDADEILSFARTHLVRAEASLALGRVSVPFDAVDYIAHRQPAWRYAQRVRILSALHAPLFDHACELLDAYVARFGNDTPLWRALLANLDAGSPVYDRLRARLIGEILVSPHDRALWRAIIGTLNASAAVDEVERQSAWRARLSL